MKLPLPIYESVKIKDDGEFSIFIGLDKKLVEQLKKYSADESDTELQKNTGDRKRFGEGAYEDWYAKDRTPFALIHNPTGSMAGLAWFGPKPLGKKSMKFEGTEEIRIESNWHAIAFRSYAPFRGRGLMKNFAKFVINFYLKEFPNVILWAGLNDKNTAVFKLNTELGFIVDRDSSDLSSNWLVMVKK